MKNRGMNVSKIEVDVNEIKEWCDKLGRPMDASARAEYAAEKLKN